MDAVTTEAALRPDLRKTCLVFLVFAVLFFPMILNPITFELFDDTKTDAESVAYIQDHWLAIRFLFSGIGIADLGLGVAFWLWGRHVTRLYSGKMATGAIVAAWLGLAGGVINLITRLYVWSKDAQGFFDFGEDIPGWALAVQLTGWVMFSAAMIIFGVLMVKGPMPTWLGVVFALCGLLVYPTGMLPLWFYLGALILGIAGLRRYRTGGPLTESTSEPLAVTT
jgi:hypothetical protein